MATSPSPQHTPPISPPPLSHLSSLIYDTSHQLHLAMDHMLAITSEIEEHSNEIMEEIEKCKESVMETKKVLDEDQETFQNAAYAALEILSHRY